MTVNESKRREKFEMLFHSHGWKVKSVTTRWRKGWVGFSVLFSARLTSISFDLDADEVHGRERFPVYAVIRHDDFSE